METSQFRSSPQLPQTILSEQSQNACVTARWPLSLPDGLLHHRGWSAGLTLHNPNPHFCFFTFFSWTARTCLWRRQSLGSSLFSRSRQTQIGTQQTLPPHPPSVSLLSAHHAFAYNNEPPCISNSDLRQLCQGDGSPTESPSRENSESVSITASCHSSPPPPLTDTAAWSPSPTSSWRHLASRPKIWERKSL